jgi:hypothetical protein
MAFEDEYKEPPKPVAPKEEKAKPVNVKSSAPTPTAAVN